MTLKNIIQKAMPLGAKLPRVSNTTIAYSSLRNFTSTGATLKMARPVEGSSVRLLLVGAPVSLILLIPIDILIILGFWKRNSMRTN
jgi:hypothetical protein